MEKDGILKSGPYFEWTSQRVSKTRWNYYILYKLKTCSEPSYWKQSASNSNRIIFKNIRRWKAFQNRFIERVFTSQSWRQMAKAFNNKPK